MSGTSGISRDAVWAALGDPIRRAMLDRLREGPATTGELEEAIGRAGFSGGTRFKYLHHLKLLRDAGLVTTAAVGRTRRNHLNAVALYEATIGWLRPPDAAVAGGLSRLKALAETTTGGHDMTIGSFEVRQQISIAAPRERVWAALVEEVDQWWGAPYLLTADGAEVPEEAVTLAIPLEVGAAVVEQKGALTELWGVVSASEPGRLIGWTGAMGMPQPAWSEVRYELDDAEGGTLVTVTHEGLAANADRIQAGYSYGWDDLNHRLRAWVEAGEAHGVAGDNQAVPGFGA